MTDDFAKRFADAFLLALVDLLPKHPIQQLSDELSDLVAEWIRG